ncbi:MAG TPA: hypothetical protein VK497_02825 [Candidatus Saccharimonadales bacterium]|nr:hypothetical protein [Candidatus Saccharimonadales bacterium]
MTSSETHPETIILDPAKYELDDEQFGKYELDDERLGTVLSDLYTSNGIRIHIADARPEGPEKDENGNPIRVGKTYLMPRHFLSFTDVELDQLHDGVLADAMGARIIAIDTPGTSLHETSGKTTLRQKLKLLGGSFSDHARLQLEAVRALGLEDLDKAGLIGFSLGAKAVASMFEGTALEDNNIKVESVDLLEPVNDRNWFLPKLMAAMTHEDKQVDRYLMETFEAQSRDPDPEIAERVSGPRITAYDRDEKKPTKKIKGKTTPISMDSALVAAGMGTAGFARKLARYKRANPEKFEDVPINVYRAEGSQISRRKTNKQTAEALGANYFEVSAGADEKPLGHRFWISLGRAAILGKELVKHPETKVS